MTRLVDAATEVLAFLREQRWRGCIIGGLAVQRWGEPRQTRDVDLTVVTGLGDEALFVDGLLNRFARRVPDARDFALQHRVLLLIAGNGVAMDIALGGLSFEERMVSRATTFVTTNTSLVTCSAEDLVVLKAFAGRAQDWLDVEGVIVRQGTALDRALIASELGPLLELKEDDSPSAMLDALFAKHPSR